MEEAWLWMMDYCKEMVGASRLVDSWLKGIEADFNV